MPETGRLLSLMINQDVNEKEENESRNPSMQITRDVSGLPLEIEQAAALWPFNFSSLTTPALATQLTAYLPCYDRALSPIEAYSSGFLWLCMAIDRTEALDDLLPLFYSPPSQIPVISAETEAQA